MIRPLLWISCACGRLGFEPANRGGGDAAAVFDGGVVIPDGLTDPDALASCAAPAPFLHYLEVSDNGNGAIQTVSYCSAGLAGPLHAELIRTFDSQVFTSADGPIEAARIELVIGGADCIACFVRLACDGVVDDGPIGNFIGD